MLIYLIFFVKIINNKATFIFNISNKKFNKIIVVLTKIRQEFLIIIKDIKFLLVFKDIKVLTTIKNIVFLTILINAIFEDVIE